MIEGSVTRHAQCSLVKFAPFSNVGAETMLRLHLQGPLLSKCLLGNKWMPMLKRPN